MRGYLQFVVVAMCLLVVNEQTHAEGPQQNPRDQPGIVPLLCNVHPEMSGYIIVSPTPYFSETDASGHFKIDHVPDGKYRVVAWHEGSKQQTKSIEVAGAGKVDFTLAK